MGLWSFVVIAFLVGKEDDKINPDEDRAISQSLTPPLSLLVIGGIVFLIYHLLSR